MVVPFIKRKQSIVFTRRIKKKQWKRLGVTRMAVHCVPRGVVGVDAETRSKISARYKRITKAVNNEFWKSTSETDHSFYVGSYGRGTATADSDLDILLSLPRDEYERYDGYSSNGQSRLLQAVKDAVLVTYPNSNIRGDGQVVIVDFSDGMKFELLPAFERVNDWGEADGYDYPDTHRNGRWLATHPKKEQVAMKEKNKSSNGLLFDTCKHIRNLHVERCSSYKLSGIVVDSFVFTAIGGWYWNDGDCDGSPVGSYESSLLEEYNNMTSNGLVTLFLRSPGAQQAVDARGSYECLGKILRYMAE